MQAFSRRFRGWQWAAALAAVCGALLLQGCDNERVATTEEDLTTEAQVYAKWGQPENIWEGQNGERILEYNRQPQGTTNYQITIGPDGKVVALRQVLNRDNFDRVKPGMMMEDVRRMLGKPARIVPYALKKETVYTWRYREGHNRSSVFEVTFDPDLTVIRTEHREDPEDMTNPDNKP